jgi:hypothetical protein
MFAIALASSSAFAMDALPSGPTIAAKQVIASLPAPTRSKSKPTVATFPNQLIPSLPGAIVQPLPQQIASPLTGQLVRSLPGQMVQPLPGQVVQALSGQLTQPLPDQIVK